MQYFFVLGTNTALSFAELAAVINFKNPKLLAPDFLIVDCDHEINADKLIKRLGGTIKIGRILEKIDQNNPLILEEEVRNIAKARQARNQEGKFNFGLSDYGQHGFNKKDIGLKLKKYFSEAGISSRFVISREKTLSSVVITQNKLLKKGIEIILAAEDKQTYIGETMAVQLFKDLSLRDYGRPARDDLSGMLPPKLAQIMLNLAQIPNENSEIVDPFCGSGTILSEALLMGYKHLFGSDISLKAIEDTRKNISWTRELYKTDNFKLKLLVKDAAYLSKFIKADSIEAIITEPFLGPQRGLINFNQVIPNLESLYSEAIKEFLKILKTGGRVVMIWPLFYGQRPITSNYTGFKILNMIPENIESSKFLKKNSRETIVYGRPGQKVYREVVVLEKM